MSIECYVINPHSNRVCTELNTGIFPESRPDYYFYNVGKTTTYCEAIYGTAFSWIGPISGKEIYPGGGAVVSTGGRSYYVTGQKVTNRGGLRALVHCSTTRGGGGSGENNLPLKIDINNLSKKLVSFGVSKIPYVGEVLSVLIDFFWPENQESVWDQIKDQVESMLDNKIMETIQSILGGELRYMQERIRLFNMELNDPNSSAPSSHYMNIAEDLIGFEKKFSFAPQHNSKYKDVNYFLLPMYSAVINLKVTFYQFGVKNQKKIGLKDDQIYKIKNYLTVLVEDKNDGALVYVQKVFQDQFDLEYDTCNSDAIYDSLAVVRQYCAINGFEYFELWKEIANNPLSNTKPNTKAIGYSTIFARATPIITRQLVVDEVPVPLKPKLVNGKYNKITKLESWIFRMGGGIPKIQGMKIFYENGDTHEMGKRSNEVNTIDFKGKYLRKLTVFGRGALDKFEFEFTDGSKQESGNGSESWGRHTVFELEDHIIAGIFVANDVSGLGGQSAGIAVSYLVTPKP